MRKHTPGPWLYKNSAIIAPDVPAWDDPEAPPTTIVDLRGTMGGIDTRADANVMAAAPELLDALEELREAVTELYKAGRISAEPFVRAGNAIARARGEA